MATSCTSCAWKTCISTACECQYFRARRLLDQKSKTGSLTATYESPGVRTRYAVCALHVVRIKDDTPYVWELSSEKNWVTWASFTGGRTWWGHDTNGKEYRWETWYLQDPRTRAKMLQARDRCDRPTFQLRFVSRYDGLTKPPVLHPFYNANNYMRDCIPHF